MSPSLPGSCAPYKNACTVLLYDAQEGNHALHSPTRHLNGHVLTPQDAGYDEARTVFAAHVDRRPALIVRVEGPNDVAQVIAHAARPAATRRPQRRPQPRGSRRQRRRHRARSLGAALLRAGCRGRTAWAGPGLTAGEYTVRAGERGLATGFGDTGSVGIGGITLAGGIGFLCASTG